MKVVFSAPQKLGNRAFKKGPADISDALAYNRAFKLLVKSGSIQILPKDAAAQKIQTARDVKAIQKAKAARIASKALKSSPSASDTSGAVPPLPKKSKAAQPISMPAKPIQAGVAAAPATASQKS